MRSQTWDVGAKARRHIVSISLEIQHAFSLLEVLPSTRLKLVLFFII